MNIKSIVSCNIRVEENSWNKLRIIASNNKRSINKEIEYIIDLTIKDYEEKYGKIIIKGCYFENDKSISFKNR